MFVSPHQDKEAQQQQATAVAMQEIEVISMVDGEDNVTTNTTSFASSTPSALALPSLESPLPSSVMANNYNGAPPPPPLPSSSYNTSPSSSLENNHSSAAASSSSIQDDGDDDEAMETLFAMLAKERTLPPIDHRARSKVKATPISIATTTTNDIDNNNDDNDDPVNDYDRTKMCDWYYEMSDFLKIDRATASRSLTLLDRFMAAPIHHNDDKVSSTANNFNNATSASASSSSYNVAGVVVAASQNRDEYQLVALTALFLAIKLFERLNIQPEHVSYLSRGRYTSCEVIKMEMVMLEALGWRACAADKVDYVDAYLDVVFPNIKNLNEKKMTKESRRASTNDDEDDEDDEMSLNDIVPSHECDDGNNLLFTSLRDLANLQIQLSDFESSFSTQKQSLVAFAAVINAFEMKKDKLSLVDQHLFLESVQRLMNKMYKSTSYYNKERQELARTVERLRVLVDPPSPSRSPSSSSDDGGSCSSTNSSSCIITSPPPPSSVELTPTSHQKNNISNNSPLQTSSTSGGGSIVGNATSTSTPKYKIVEEEDVSPLDVALESMENFDMAQLLCCGSNCGIPLHDIMIDDYNAGINHDQDSDDHVLHQEEEEEEDDYMVTEEELAKLESAVSFSSAVAADADTNNNGKNTHSPTSIATILFGSAGMKK